jgi:hypothetical protein
VTAKYANHAKKEAAWGFPSRIWRISRLNLFASGRRPRPGLCAPVVKIRATTPRCPVSFRQQSQTWAPSGIWGRRAGEPIVRNKPNSRRCRATGVLYKQTQFPGGTRPGGQARGCDYAKQTQFGQSGWDRRAECAKQSQTWASWGIWGMAYGRSLLCETKPIPGLRIGDIPAAGRLPRRRAVPSLLYKQTQFVAWRAGPAPGAIVQNKANPAAARWASAWWERSYGRFDMRAKRTQFRAVRRDPRGERPERIVQNKANSPGGPGGTEHGNGDMATIVRNKAKLGRPGVSGEGASGEPVVRNKANSWIADCAKQTQLGRAGGAPESKMRQTNPIPGRSGLPCDAVLPKEGIAFPRMLLRALCHPLRP